VEPPVEPPIEPPVEPPSVCGTVTGSNFTETAAGLNIEMVFVKCGRIKIGCDVDTCGELTESPANLVELSSYYIGKFLVTQGQWNALMDTNPSIFKGDDNRPVEMVNWNDVQTFIEKLNERSSRKKYRLPTNAEWEYAARGGAESKGYKYSGSNIAGDVAWYADNSGGSVDDRSTRPVGTKAPNELGLHDMSGNLWEWVSDRFGKYAKETPLGTAVVNPKGPETGDDRVIRGGSYTEGMSSCRVSARTREAPGNTRRYIGFRVALPAE
jgi:formylglycine-generating enzyme required for sulfatase activity